ncbi:MAG: gamma-glutamyl-gamma-aminobutyrate hydrolase family protein [Anaerolineaceae bacterium]
MSSPLIGITTKYKVIDKKYYHLLSIRYTDAVLAAGGIPVLIPARFSHGQCTSLVERLDGLLLTGGGDIDPARFGGTLHRKVNGVSPERDTVEIELAHLAVSNRLPFLGICRGMQVVNVALGGTLYTHILDQLPGALQHSHVFRDRLHHMVALEDGSRLADIVGTSELSVNSLHHQGIKDLAPGLRATAHSRDGLVEAVELAGHPFGLAVQWHPEELQRFQEQKTLFKAFIQAAETYRQARG